MACFPVFQLGLISDASLAHTNPVCNYVAGPGGRASISLPSASTQLCAYVHWKILLHNVIVICLYICLSHELMSFLRARVVSDLPLYPHNLIDLWCWMHECCQEGIIYSWYLNSGKRAMHDTLHFKSPSFKRKRKLVKLTVGPPLERANNLYSWFHQLDRFFFNTHIFKSSAKWYKNSILVHLDSFCYRSPSNFYIYTNMYVFYILYRENIYVFMFYICKICMFIYIYLKL